MEHEFTYATLGKTKLAVSRLGLTATYRPGKRAIYNNKEPLIDNPQVLFCELHGEKC
jgi:hypothetical protein